MATITVRVTEDEKAFLDAMAKFEGKSLSELLKTTTLDVLEESYDAHIADLAYRDHQENPQTRPFADLMAEYGLEYDA